MTGRRARQWTPRPRDPEAEQRLPDAGVDPLLARRYAARGITDPDQLERRFEALERPDGLLGMDGAVDVLAGALARGERICIVGDFDCDGGTSTAVAMSWGPKRARSAMPPEMMAGMAAAKVIRKKNFTRS